MLEVVPTSDRRVVPADDTSWSTTARLCGTHIWLCGLQRQGVAALNRSAPSARYDNACVSVEPLAERSPSQGSKGAVRFDYFNLAARRRHKPTDRLRPQPPPLRFPPISDIQTAFAECRKLPVRFATARRPQWGENGPSASVLRSRWQTSPSLCGRCSALNSPLPRPT